MIELEYRILFCLHEQHLSYSQLRMVSIGTSMQSANSAWLNPSFLRMRRANYRKFL